MDALAGLKQRADYTHKHNMCEGRHGWIRLTPAYSVKVVEEVLSSHTAGERVLDPFCGSGTTALCAVQRGLSAVTTDINPFLVWLAGVKARGYDATEVAVAHDASEAVLAHAEGDAVPAAAPPIHRIDRWWSEEDLSFLCKLKGAMDGLGVPQPMRDLLSVAFCRTLIDLSNAAFNHQSVSFKDQGAQLDIAPDRPGVFRSSVARVLGDCAEPVGSKAQAVMLDARKLDPAVLGRFDVVVTSPPYANRMSYVRELRPYMYWLGHFRDARDAGELDWESIGGTWGVATSRLNGWHGNGAYAHDHLSDVLSAVSRAEGRHAKTLALYIHKYFEDIFSHMTALAGVLNPGAKVHYIVGNSTFYGVLLKTEMLYADMMERAGLTGVSVEPIRKRNSKKELVEFEVSATAP